MTQASDDTAQAFLMYLFASVRMVEETYFSNMACSCSYGGSTISLAVCVCVRGARAAIIAIARSCRPA